MSSARPLIGIPADRRMVSAHPFHMVGEKYARAVLDAAGAAPLLIPALADELGFEELLERLDGLLFTGSPSNVEPHRYEGPPSAPGTLHQKLHEVPGHLDHRDDGTQPLEVQYGPAHDVTLEPGGMLRAFAAGERIRVNSLHSQGIDRLGPELEVEARAPDGVIEAFRVRNAQRFALAVQWHPEWKVMSNPFSRALFAAFGEASRERAAAK